MADYSKQTVAQLRQLLKDRGIASTGLQRKAQIIEKLKEEDGKSSGLAEPSEVVEEGKEAEVVRENAKSSLSPSLKPDLSPETAAQAGKKATSADQMETADSATATAPMANVFVPLASSEIESMAPEHDTQIHAHVVTQPANTQTLYKGDTQTVDDALPVVPTTDSATLTEPIPSTQQPAAPSVERAELLPIPERSTAETSRLGTEELEADAKKRKRRSDTPEIPTQDIKAKKRRRSTNNAPEVYLKEDLDVDREHGQVIADTYIQKPAEGRTDGNHPMQEGEQSIVMDNKEKSSRYQDVMSPATQHSPIDTIALERPTMPALHSVTSSLYIRNFMRPLRPENLRAHLISLATLPSQPADPTIIHSLFLDAMKTHALVSFTNSTAASRVRASLHGSIWPPEGNRKELWVDFIPDTSIDDWIKEEQDTLGLEKEARARGRSLPPKRFEVTYPALSDGSVTAVFQQVGASTSLTSDPRRGSTQQPRLLSLPTQDETREVIQASLNTLDDLFASTATLPKLFFMPVSALVERARLRELGSETSRDWRPAGLHKGRTAMCEELYRYTFDADDRIVESEEDKGPWSGGGNKRERGRGGYSGRGGRGGGRGRDEWRR